MLVLARPETSINIHKSVGQAVDWWQRRLISAVTWQAAVREPHINRNIFNSSIEVKGTF